MRHKDEHQQVLTRMAYLIREERRARNLTQQEVAKQLQVTQGSLSKLENGESAPNVVVWLRFCSSFGLPENIPMNDARYKAHAKHLEKMAEKNKFRARIRGTA